MRQSDATRANEDGKRALPPEPSTKRGRTWRRLVCAMRGHELFPAIPTHALRCDYCDRVWTWIDLFRARIPRTRWHTQRAYDDPVYHTSMTIGTGTRLK